MLDVGWLELMVVLVVTFVVVGPRDLPKVMRALGEWTAKGRRLVLALQHEIERMGEEGQEPTSSVPAPDFSKEEDKKDE